MIAGNFTKKGLDYRRMHIVLMSRIERPFEGGARISEVRIREARVYMLQLNVKLSYSCETDLSVAELTDYSVCCATN